VAAKMAHDDVISQPLLRQSQPQVLRLVKTPAADHDGIIVLLTLQNCWA
jgi:hypothetical protein